MGKVEEAIKIIEQVVESAEIEHQDIELDSTGRQLETRLLCPKHRFISKVMKRRQGIYSLICGCDREKTLEPGQMQPAMLSYPEKR